MCIRDRLYTPLLSFGAVQGGVSLYELIRVALGKEKERSRNTQPAAMEAPVSMA